MPGVIPALAWPSVAPRSAARETQVVTTPPSLPMVAGVTTATAPRSTLMTKTLAPQPVGFSVVEVDLLSLALIAGAFALGGVLKGAIGAGAPIIAVPVLALLYDIQTAVALFVMPNLVSNLVQSAQFWRSRADGRFTWVFAAAGFLGTGAGTVMLARLESDFLMLFLALTVFLYIMFRLLRPDWGLSMDASKRLSEPLGALSGVLKGAAGVSAPNSVTFLNAMRLERAEFVATSRSFRGDGGDPAAAADLVRIMTVERFWQSCLSIAPLMLFMPVGAMLGRRLDRQWFDRAIMGVLALLALKILVEDLA